MDRRRIIAVFVLAAALAGGAWFLGENLNRTAPALQAATALPERRPLPDFRLRNHEDAPFTRDDLRGKTSLLFFGFTHCPDICPATLQQLALARRQLDANMNGELPEIVLISVDPARDTPEVLERYVGYFGEGITGATGNIEQLRSLTGPLGVHFEQVPPATDTVGEDYAVNHSAAVLVVDAEARLQAIFSAPHHIESFVHDLPILMAAR